MRQADSFSVLVEIDPPTRPEMWRVDAALAAMASCCDGFVVPDNHLGRATISSIAVASRAAVLGRRAIACLNARDRNVLGLRRDLLTAAAFGVRDFLFVYGDEPEAGFRTMDLNSRKMFEEAHAFVSDERFDRLGPFRFGAVSRVGRKLGWRVDCDFLFVQITHDLDALSRWRDRLAYDGAIFPGVVVLTSRAMAGRLSRRIPELEVASDLLERLDADREAGVRVALDQVESIREAGGFSGVHLIPANRHDAVARELTRLRTPVAT